MRIKKDNRRIISHLIEFFIVGVAMGVVEDLIAIKFATEAEITWHVFKVAFLVALPFAFISELLVDLSFFRKKFKKFRKKLR